MKKIWKQPFFYIACISFLLAICVGVVSSVSQPKVSVLEKWEKGVNKGSQKILISCFPPEQQALLTGMAALGAGLEDMTGDMGKVTLIYSQPVEDEDGNMTVVVAALEYRDGQCVDLDVEHMELTEVNGKLYLSDF